MKQAITIYTQNCGAFVLSSCWNHCNWSKPTCAT